VSNAIRLETSSAAQDYIQLYDEGILKICELYLSSPFSARSRRWESTRSLGCGFVAQRPTGRLNA
jgi:hypothetical protein